MLAAVCPLLPPPQLHGVLWVAASSCLYTLTNSRLSKWEVEDASEQQVLSWDVQKALTESILDAIWVGFKLAADAASATNYPAFRVSGR